MKLFTDAIKFVDPANNAWFVKVVCAARALSPDDGLDMLLTWAHGTPQFLEVREVWEDAAGHTSMHSVDEVLAIAKDNGWQVDSTDAPLLKIQALTKTSDFCFRVPRLPDHSLVRVLYEDMLASSFSPLPPAILASSIGAIGALRGGLHETQTGLRPNIYSMIVANSGTGKSIARDYIFSLFAEIGADKYLMGEPQSAQGINTALQAQEFRFLFWEEIGLALKAITSKNSSSYQMMILKYLMELFSNKIALGFEYADEKRKTKKLLNSCLNLVGITTGERLYSSLDSDFMSDGLLPRFLFFDTGDLLPVKKILTTKVVSEDLRLRTSALSYKSRLADPEIFNFEPIVLEQIEFLQDKIREKSKEIIKNKKPDYFLAIQSRTLEHAMKLSLIFSDENSGKITYDDFQCALKICEQNEKYLMRVLMSKIDENQNRDQATEAIERFIKDSKKVSKNDLYKKFRFRAGCNLTKILENLIEADVVHIIDEGHEGGGRPRKMIYFNS